MVGVGDAGMEPVGAFNEAEGGVVGRYGLEAAGVGVGEHRRGGGLAARVDREGRDRGQRRARLPGGQIKNRRSARDRKPARHEAAQQQQA
jgi:hypothetical protein